MDANKKILIYDGSCRTCTVMKNAADATVSNYDFVDATSEEGRRIAAEKNLDINSSAYIVDGERVASRSDMALEVVRDMRFVGPLLASTALVLPFSWRESAYEWLVRHRIR